MSKKHFFYFILSLSIFSTSCKKGFDTGWETDIITPILHGTLTIDDLLPDSIREVNADNSVDLVYQNTIFDLKITDLVDVPDTTVSVTVNLDSLSITDKTVTETISLGEIATSLAASGDFTGTLIILANGSELVIDPLTGLASGTDSIDATSFFETATFEVGYLDILIKNDLPIAITNIEFQLRNSSDGALIAEDTYPLIEPGEFELNTYSLAGLSVDGMLLAEIINFDSPGSAPDAVLIDTSDNVLIQLTAHDMELFSATAIFPPQNLVNKQNEVEYLMGVGGPEITEMTLDSGTVFISVINTIEDTIHVTYSLPYATSPTGEPVSFETVCDPAPAGGFTTKVQEYNLSGYHVDLRGQNGNKANTFYQEFSASIDSTGEVRTLSLNDSIVVEYGLVNIKPLEVKGYIGSYHEEYSDNANLGFNVLDFIDDGEIHFDDVNVTLTVTNGVGVDARFVINNLIASNSTSGETIALEAAGVIGVPIQVERAIENPFIEGLTQFTLNNSNSNILDLLEIFPDAMSYDISLDINPEGNIYNYQDFVLPDSKTTLTLDLELPLNVLADNVTLIDTFDIDINTDEESDQIDNIQSIELTLLAENSFPLSTSIEIIFFDDFGFAVDTLNFDGSVIEGGELNASCKVEEPKQTNITVLFTGERINTLLEAKEAKVTAVFNTPTDTPCGETVKIYSNYKLEMHLTGHMNYIFSTNND
ncbi:MAG: hypothetical protein H7Y00_13235 [Fimbriimonadaceae bacterium]|nr:hypothetical protein [Chitinophagales bacterium]